MPDDRSDQPSDDIHDPRDGRGLNWAERLAAGLLGLGIAGAGIDAVFTREVEAGPTALLLVGAVFLLLAVQGTPIRKANKDSVEWERRASVRQIAREGKERLEERGAGDAEAFIEGASVANPSVVENILITQLQSTIQNARDYERILLAKLEELMTGTGWTLFPSSAIGDNNLDFLIAASEPHGGKFVSGIIKFTHGAGALSQLKKRLEDVQLNLWSWPILIVTNADWPHRDVARRQLFESEPDNLDPISIVRWRGSQDDEELKTAIRNVTQQ